MMNKKPPFTKLRALLAAAAFSLVLPNISAANAAAFPAKPVTVIVPYPAGGTGDLVARYMGRQLSERWKQPVIIDNRPGGGTVIGASAVANSRKDGYTLLFTVNTHVIHSHLIKDLPYDTMKDFSPIATMASSAYALLIGSSMKVKNLSEFIAHARNNPGQINFGVQGIGGLTHLAAELLDQMADIKMQMVPYKGAAPAMAGILSGEIDAYFDAPATTVPYVKDGRMKALGVSGMEPVASLPGVPTISEAGVPGFDIVVWYGLFAPAGTPEPVIDKIANDVLGIVSEPSVSEDLSPLGVTIFPKGTTEFKRWIEEENAKYEEIIKEGNIALQ